MSKGFVRVIVLLAVIGGSFYAGRESVFWQMRQTWGQGAK